MLYYEFLYQYIAHFCACKEMTMCDNECTKKQEKKKKQDFNNYRKQKEEEIPVFRI